VAESTIPIQVDAGVILSSKYDHDKMILKKYGGSGHGDGKVGPSEIFSMLSFLVIEFQHSIPWQAQDGPGRFTAFPTLTMYLNP
jgi:hypothetical protein